MSLKRSLFIMEKRKSSRSRNKIFLPFASFQGHTKDDQIDELFEKSSCLAKMGLPKIILKHIHMCVCVRVTCQYLVYITAAALEPQLLLMSIVTDGRMNGIDQMRATTYRTSS